MPDLRAPRSSVRQYLKAGLIGEVHFAIATVMLGRGESMFAGLDLHPLGYRIVRDAATDATTHFTLAK